MIPAASDPPSTSSFPLSRRVERIAWFSAAVLFGLHCWLYRHEMVNLDGVSYLELAWAWRDGRWADALNGYWSPLYPIFLALMLAVANPSPAWEYPAVHAANGIAGLLALGAFTYFVRAWRSDSDREARVMPRWAREAVAYALFIWASIVLLVVWMESPDMLLATFIFLTAGALARIAEGDVRLRTFAVLGLAIGLGSLTKSAMLPIGGLFFLGAAAAAVRQRAWHGVVLAALVAATLIGPWVLALSISRGRLTFGDTGRINYIWFVNGSEDWPDNWPPHWPHWSGDPANGSPHHPARRLNEDPAVYEFATPVAGTYPMWYDVSVWYEGVRPYFDVADQLRRLKISAADLYAVLALNPYNPMVFNPQPALLALLGMSALAIGGAASLRAFMRSSPIWLPAVGAIGMYTAVYVEPRYVGAFILLVWVSAVNALRSPDGTRADRRVLQACGTAMAAVICAAVLVITSIEAYPAMRRILRGEPDREPVAWRTAQRMQQEGLEAGDLIAVAGSAQRASRWTHLARLRIVAEVPLIDAPKLVADASARQRAEDAIRGAGVEWMVIDHPGETNLPGWRRVEGTPYMVKRLQ